MTDYYRELMNQFPVILLEDGLAEDDWAGWKYLHDKLGGRAELVGDDLFVTNVKYIRRGIEENLASAALIKLNQIARSARHLTQFHCVMKTDGGLLFRTAAVKPWTRLSPI